MQNVRCDTIIHDIFFIVVVYKSNDMLVDNGLYLTEWYLEALSCYADVAKHLIRQDSWNKDISQLRLWRQPRATLSVSPILHYKWTFDQTGYYWPSSRSVISFVEGGDAKTVLVLVF